MRNSFLIISVVLAWAGIGGRPVLAQVDSGFHEFTDKKGQKVSAKLVGVTEDRRVMKIVREDGRAFETVINQLSLDDQQFVKDWLKTSGGVAAPSAPSEYRVDVSVTRTVGGSSKHSNDNYAFEGKDNLFRVTVKNLSSDTLASAKVEYAVVWKDSVSIYEDKDDAEWDFRSHANDGVSPSVKVLGNSVLENMRFNVEFTFETTPVSIERVLYDGNELYREDELLGLRVRVVSADGAVIHDTHSGSAELGSMTWEAIQALEDPPVID